MSNVTINFHPNVIIDITRNSSWWHHYCYK